ncbi:hypothetical protein [Paraburkholderia tropica]|uniref:Uncharacterized protein n=1 Tax=Paraburkholderia tropica TaxID=92647 RepID=A0AAQ1GMP3_9BURK|nr:hypothetical protein [Paraburkholderia tropica]RQN35647.1 hypothetical protein EHZ25_27595 [Paraburkholderia tropica]SEK13386.1 hypothetical protein SAMN05216550_1242 [Paraburkholderia tropica]
MQILDYPFSRPNDASTHGHSSWEQEDKARHFIEAGFPDWKRNGYRLAGGGESSELAQAIFGDSLEDFEKAVEHEYPSRAPSPYIFQKRLVPVSPDARGPLTAAQFVDLYSAIAFANFNGQVFNVHVSITWELLGINRHEDAADAFCNSFRKPLERWYRDKVGRKHPFVWLYVHEIGQTHGFHTHFLISIPDSLRPAFKEWVKARLSKISRVSELDKCSFNVEWRTRSAGSMWQQWKWFGYVMKGVDLTAQVLSVVGPDPFQLVAELFPDELKNGGKADCKLMCGVSRKIGQQSRRNARFRSLLEHGVVDVRRLYAGLEYLGYLRRRGLGVGDPIVPALLRAEVETLEIAALESANAEVYKHERRQRSVARHLDQQKARRERRERVKLMQRLQQIFSSSCRESADRIQSAADSLS